MDTLDIADTPDAEDAFRMGCARVKEHLDGLDHLRILVIGRPKSGKTTLLQRICNTTKFPEIFNAKGEKIDPVIAQESLESGSHDINDELIFKSNPGFIFHDSRVFDFCSSEEPNVVKDFIMARAVAMELKRQIHVIWFCIPMTEYEYPILAGEEEFFNELNVGNVPVITVLTKADAFWVEAIGQLRDERVPMKKAKLRAGELADQLRSGARARIESQLSGCKYPPKAYILTAYMDQEGADCTPLLRCTTDALNEVEPRRFLLQTRASILDSNPVEPLHTVMLWLFDRFKETGTMADLSLAIALGKAALKLRPPGIPSRDTSLHALSCCLHARFQKLGEVSNLQEAITLGRGALDLRPSGHCDRIASLNSLFTYIVAMFDQRSDRITDIEEAVSTTRSVVEIWPHKERLDFLCKLSDLLLSRFRRQGCFADLEGAGKLHRDILELCPHGHPELASSLHGLALYLSERFDQQGVSDHLERAIALIHSALDLRPPGDPDRVASLKILATYRQKKLMEPPTEVAPTGIKRLIRDAIDDTLETLPPRLLNTQTGCLCGRDELVSDFESSKQYQELLSLTDHCDDTENKTHVREMVSDYFRYVTLSHRWGKREPLLGEIKVHSIYAATSDPTEGLLKLHRFCTAACECGYMWAWSDTCCIDKDSSVELQEAIGSMYSWYQRSALTIVHLADVTDAGSLSGSEWFQRGWTLQELLASKTIRFFTRSWDVYRGCVALNHKDDGAVLNELVEATRIARDYLVNFHPSMDDARSRFQWASQRRTTRPEDMAYSLFGIFGVHLPILYGESKQKALARLLEEIVSNSGDISVLDWVGEASSSHSCFPANIASYETVPCPPPIPHRISIPSSLPITQQAELSEALCRLYSSLSKSEPPQFLGRRLRLPCIMHRVTVVRLPNPSVSGHLFEIKAKGLRPLEVSLSISIKLQDGVHSKLPYVLIRPWHPKLLLKSSLTSVAPAEQVMTILGQPFNALLLEELPLNEYKRIASSSAIYAYPADVSSIFQSKVHTLNIV